MATVNGTNGADILFDDPNEHEFRFVFGFDGADLLFGRPGQDVLVGGRGNDILDSGMDPRVGQEEGRTITIHLFGNELFGGRGRDIGIIDGREDLWVGDDSGPERFSDIAIIRNAHNIGAGTLITGFDVRGKGAGNLVQDRFFFADSEGFDVENFDIRGIRDDLDGTGIVGRLAAFTLKGDGGELCEFRIRWADGRPVLHADDDSPEAIEAAIAIWTDQFALDGSEASLAGIL